MDKLYTKAEIEIDEKGMTAIASNAVEDRHGEIVSVEGWDLKNFKKNPVLLWAHDHTIPAIGAAKNIKVEGTGKKAALTFEPVFHDYTDQAKALKKMVEEKIINSFSVGFKPLEVDGNTYTKQELLEISLVNVPANPEARMMAYKSLQDAGFSKDVCKDVIGEVEEVDAVEEVQETDAVEELKAQVQEITQKYQLLSNQYEDLVKGVKNLNPMVDKKEAITTRLTLHKAIGRATDKLLESKPKGKDALIFKVIKRANDKLIYDSKQELRKNGKN